MQERPVFVKVPASIKVEVNIPPFLDLLPQVGLDCAQILLNLVLSSLAPAMDGVAVHIAPVTSGDQEKQPVIPLSGGTGRPLRRD